MTDSIRDDAGRLIAGPQSEPIAREPGPWDENGALKPIATTCGWCRDAREETARLTAQGFAVSHAICPPCKAKLDAEMDAMERRAA